MEKTPEKLTRLRDLRQMLKLHAQALDEQIDQSVRELENLRSTQTDRATKQDPALAASLEAECATLEAEVSDLRSRRSQVGHDLSKLAGIVERLDEYCRAHGIGTHPRAAYGSGLGASR